VLFPSPFSTVIAVLQPLEKYCERTRDEILAQQQEMTVWCKKAKDALDDAKGVPLKISKELLDQVF
jgi:hypothetical protein